MGTVAGVTAFLFLLLFAVQVTATLYATSTTEAAGYDAARSVAAASAGGTPASMGEAVRRAEAQFRDLLGRRGEDAELDWDIDEEHVSLHVVVDAPSILPSVIRDTAQLRRIERTFTVRVERVVS